MDPHLKAIKLDVDPELPDNVLYFRARKAAETLAEMQILERLARAGVTLREPPEHGWNYNPPEPAA